MDKTGKIVGMVSIALMALLVIGSVVALRAGSSDQTAVAATCTDSDGGQNVELKGLVTYDPFTAYTGSKNVTVERIDTCVDSMHLKEYYCSSGRPAYKEYDCSGIHATCVNGECQVY